MRFPWPCLLAGFLVCGSAQGVKVQTTPLDSGWELIHEEGPVRVYSQPRAEGRPMGIRGISRARVRFEVLASVLLDVPAYPEWMKQLRESRVVERRSDDDYLIYNYYSLPWPFADRDIYLRINIERNIPQGRAFAYIRREESHLRPPVPGVVRIPRMEGVLQLDYVDRETTQGTFTEWFDMGGDIPEWLKRTFTRHIPPTVLKSVAKACQRPEYQKKGAESPLRLQVEQALAAGQLHP
ncbi:MAG: START domain-containing protein [Geothrix sp.]|uniref:START domain-containing protein n=1 Tax=Geothrix sp. TaxID=1962974 RepID=UPI003BB10096